jgi:hypothetical protein
VRDLFPVKPGDAWAEMLSAEELRMRRWDSVCVVETLGLYDANGPTKLSPGSEA